MLALLQQAPPADTVNYMIAGYTVIFGVILVYLVSLALRQRNYKRDEEMLEDLDEKSSHK
jgi:CcmD family protein